MNKIGLWKAALLTGALACCLAVSAQATHVGIGTVQGEGLRLRADPGLQGKVLATAHKGDRVTVLKQEGDWYQVDYATQVGYMSSGFLEVATSAEGDLGYAMVTTESDALNLRATEKLASIPHRTVVALTAFQNGWYQTSYNGHVGYVSSDYLTPVRDAQGTRADGATDAPAASDLGQRIVAEAKKHLGKPYVYGTHGPNSFDCAGFAYYCVKQATGGAILLGTSASQQWANAPGQRIYSIDQLQPGDLFFIDDPAYGGNYKTVTHAAIYMGDGQLIHASSSTTGVITNPIKDKDRRYFVGAIRLG